MDVLCIGVWEKQFLWPSDFSFERLTHPVSQPSDHMLPFEKKSHQIFMRAKNCDE